MAAAPLPKCWMLVGMAPAVVAAAVAVPLAVVVVLSAVVEAAEAGSLVPQLSWIVVVQLAWPVALPTLAVLH
jgi:hypothetical protein